jgi:hypothetical protein
MASADALVPPLHEKLDRFHRDIRREQLEQIWQEKRRKMMTESCGVGVMEATKASRDFAVLTLAIQPDTEPTILEELTQQLEEALQTGEIPLESLHQTMRDLRRSPHKFPPPDFLTPLRKPPNKEAAGHGATLEPPSKFES